MSPTSTSNSESEPKPVLARFKPKEAEEVPAVGWAWSRWLMIPVVIFMAEAIAQLSIQLDLIEKPAVYGHYHIDTKVKWFLDYYLPAEESGTRYLVMGSSMPHTNIDPQRLTAVMEEETEQDWTGFNGAFYAGRHEDMIYFLDWYYDRWEFDHLIMTFDPWGLLPGRLSNMQEQLEMPFFEAWLAEHSALFSLRNQMRLYDEGKNTRTRGLELLDWNGTMYGWVRTIQEWAYEPERPEIRAKQQADGLLDHRDNPPSQIPLTYEKLEVVKEWAAERGITVWWIIQPLSPELEPFFLKDYQYPQWRAKAEELLMGPGNYILDLKDMEGRVFTAEDFFDGNHMNPHGAAVYTEELGRRWSYLWQQERDKGAIPR